MKQLPASAIAMLLTIGFSGLSEAQQDSVVSTVHNLSASGPGEIKALGERQVCKFCHIPHNAPGPVPMWSRRLPKQSYSTPRIKGPEGTLVPAPQPDGASRLCLSCHDGTIALGEVAGQRMPTSMRGATRLRPGHRGYLGRDLSGSHPISIVMPHDAVEAASENPSDMRLRDRSEVSGDPRIKLDGEGKIQCTTCHDPHADRHFVEGQVPRFWVASTVSEVCIHCHIPG